MKITEINIVQFGKLNNRVITLDEGFNIIRGDNESGKSTVLAFIKFILYGVGRKSPSVTVGERERALAWSTGTASGSLTVIDENNKKYRIERTGREGARGVYSDKVRVLDLQNGTDAFDGEIPGEHFLGISAQAFDSMCNMRQLECASISPEAVRTVIDNILSGGDENTDVSAAIKLLDSERRRLLHTNGKGGLVFESELELEHLRSEHRGAVLAENDSIKARDELGRVELALAKARDEHEIAQRMCDLCEDVSRLEKFDELRKLQNTERYIRDELSALHTGTDFNTAFADYETLASLSGVADSLRKSLAEKDSANDEHSSLSKRLEGLTHENSDALCELVDEFGSPRSAVSFLSLKRKKKSNSTFMLTAFGICAAVLFIFAAMLAFAMGNGAGGTTVAFLGAVIFAVAVVFYKQLSDAKREISAFVQKLGDELSALGESELQSILQAVYDSRNERSQVNKELIRASMRVSLAQEKYEADLSLAKESLTRLGVALSEAEIVSALDSTAERVRAFISLKSNLEEKLRDNIASQNSIKAMLERFNENEIRARITPEIEEKVKNTPFDRLKSERDLALHRVNQFNQYKAGIERTLLSGNSRRSSDEIFPEIEAQAERLEALKLRLDAVKLAAQAINSASSSLKSDITPRIRDNAQKMLSTLTAGKYSELIMDENMTLSVFADGATRPIEYLSKGTLDTAYFAVRLSLTNTLLAEKDPPLFMDEALSQLDDGRAENLLRAIAEHSKNSQCVLLTCQNRDVEMAKRICHTNVIEI